MSKVVLDGALFSECEMLGSNRHGMLRVAEEVTTHLVAGKELDLFFANTIYSRRYALWLKKYVTNHFPSHQHKIISKHPFFTSNIPKWGGLLARMAKQLSLNVPIKNSDEYDVFHSFYYPFPKYIQNKKIKKSITYLDIIPLRMNGYLKELVQQTKEVVESIVPNFAISISAYSKQDLVDYDKRVDPSRVFVAPLAASPELFFQNKDADDWVRVKKEYNLPDEYFLSVSSNDLRKNLPHLIRSFRKFVLQQKPGDLHLVLTGNSRYSYAILDELKIEKKVKEKIYITEKHIAETDLAVVYSHALCFFFMSLYEGFGLPALEAMQCGAPVVVSNATSLPEVVGDAGILLPPSDEEALCEAMNTLYRNSDLRSRYAVLGLHRAKQFSWERCAAEYTNIFHIISNY